MDKEKLREEFRAYIEEEDRIKKIINESDELSLNMIFNIHYYGHIKTFPMIMSQNNSGKAPTMKSLEKILKGKNPDNVTINGKTLTEIKKHAPGILYVNVSQSTGKITPKWLFCFGESYKGYEFQTAKDYGIRERHYI